MADLSVLVRQLQGAVFGAPVTALPANPTNGQVVDYLADAANGVVWRLKYRLGSPSAYKWEFVGGPPLFAEVATVQQASSAAYADLATVGPSITVPLAGDYDVEVGGRILPSNAAGQSLWMSYAIGATAAVDADGIQVEQSDAATPRGVHHSSFPRRKTGLAASTALVAKYKQAPFDVARGNFSKRWMRVKPVRVG